MVQLTVVVLARNEATNLEACIGSCGKFPVVVLDMESDDGTADVAARMGARVVPVERVAEFDRARNLAGEVCETPWILTRTATAP